MTSSMPILRTSALVTPNTRQARSLAARIIHGGLVSVVNMACAAGVHREEWPCTAVASALGSVREDARDGGPVGDSNCSSCWAWAGIKGFASASMRRWCIEMDDVSVIVRLRLARRDLG